MRDSVAVAFPALATVGVDVRLAKGHSSMTTAEDETSYASANSRHMICVWGSCTRSRNAIETLLSLTCPHVLYDVASLTCPHVLHHAPFCLSTRTVRRTFLAFVGLTMRTMHPLWAIGACGGPKKKRIGGRAHQN